MKNLDWKQILEFLFKILTPLVPKGWRTIALNMLFLLVGLSELILAEGEGLLSLLCTHLGIACGPGLAALITTIVVVLNMLIRAITNTPVGVKEPQN